MSGMPCISCKEIAFLTIINLQNSNFSGALPLGPVGGGGWGWAYSTPATPQMLLPCFALFVRASSLRSEGLPRFLLISVLMPGDWK